MRAVATAAGAFVYGPARGYRTCPRQDFRARGDDCLGEVHAGDRWHQVGTEAADDQPQIAFRRGTAQQGKLIPCRNRLGDAMRNRPGG